MGIVSFGWEKYIDDVEETDRLFRTNNDLCQ